MDHTRVQPDRPVRNVGFFVEGIAVQQGSKTLGRNRKTGAATMYESAKGLAAWRKKVMLVARSEVGPGFEPLDGPLELKIVIWMPRPASHPKSIVTYPASPPDADKLARAIGDSLTQAGIIVDDGRVVDLEVRVRYAGGPNPERPRPGAWVEVGMLR